MMSNHPKAEYEKQNTASLSGHDLPLALGMCANVFEGECDIDVGHTTSSPLLYEQPVCRSSKTRVASLNLGWITNTGMTLDALTRY